MSMLIHTPQELQITTVGNAADSQLSQPVESQLDNSLPFDFSDECSLDTTRPEESQTESAVFNKGPVAHFKVPSSSKRDCHMQTHLSIKESERYYNR